VPLTVGTAGHVDHGKTWLVRALTGKDTDRLPEEQRRGISIDLGYAPLDLGGGLRLSLVDVPGHERFVRTMVAGATGIDLFLLVLDAGEGARPQTHEHLAILRLLGVERGVVAVTKADAVDAETLELALGEARELVPGAAPVAVSAKTGAGLAELRAALAQVAAEIGARSNDGPSSEPARLYVDRVFSLRGIGTVATGTLWSGSIGAGDALVAEPGGRAVRVRSVQVHDEPVERAEAGQRVAVALTGVERRELRRGDALVAPGAFRASYRLDIVLEELEPVANGARLHLHHGTADVPARVVRAGGRFAQLRLAAPVVAARGDKLVLRTETTVGGGRVLDPAPARHADPARFERAERGLETIHAPVLVDAEWRFSDEWLAELRSGLERGLDAADPLDPGVTAPSEPWAKAVLARLPFERRGSKLYRPGAVPTVGTREAEASALAAAVEAAAPGAAKVEDADLARHLEREGRLVRLGPSHAVAPAAYERARELVAAECEARGSISLARFRDLAGCGRRDAQLLLERLDADGVTRRVGDRRVLRRSASRSA
jgi:selenocysteine-specific elongation factor